MAHGRILMLPMLLIALLAGSLATPYRTRVSAAPEAARPIVDTLRFAAQVGTASFVFYQWVYKPYTSHAFDKGANDRGVEIAKAAAALAFTAADLKSAYNLAKNSDSKALKALTPSLDKLQQQASSAANKLKDEATAKAQNAAATYLPQLKTSFDAFRQQAKAKGVNIQSKVSQ